MSGLAHRELAELLALLGPEAVQAVRAHLPPGTAAALPSMEDTVLSPRRRARLLGEFDRFVQFIRRQVAEESSQAQSPAGAADEFTPTGELELDVQQLPAARCVAVLAQEDPRLIAVFLDRLAAEHSASLLRQLPPPVRESVVREFSRGATAPIMVWKRLAGAVVQLAAQAAVEQPREDDPLRRLAEVLRATDKPLRKPLVQALTQQDADAASRLTELLYKFEDLLAFDDRAVQQLLAQIDVSTLATALGGASEAISDKVLKNLSRRAADMLREELQFAGKVAASKVDLARAAVIKVIAKVDQESE